MTDKFAKIQGIVPKVFSDTASDAELRLVSEWLDAGDDNLREFLRLKNIWEVATPSIKPSLISTRAARDGIMSRLREDRNHRRKRKIVLGWQRVAAVIAVPFIVLSVYLWLRTDSTPGGSPEICQEIFAPYGTRSKIELSDGSVVWLNAGSRLKYPVEFRGGRRSVDLEGEAFFEVTANPKLPFVVRTHDMDITALGTAFNVEAYASDSLVAVTLAEGLIDVRWEGYNVMLQPRERVVYDRNCRDHNIYMGDPFKWCSWKDGILAFRNDPLSYVFKRLGQTYNIDFVVDKHIEDHIYHATFEGESLDEILELLERSAPIRYRRTKALDGSGGPQGKQTIYVSRKIKGRN